MADYAVFRRPPVQEVVFSVFFSDPLPIRTFDGPKVHSVYAEQYPEVTEHEPVQRSDFFPNTNVMISSHPRARWWFTSNDGKELLQLQDDRFMRNWRRLSLRPDEEYPGFTKLLERFMNNLDALISFFADAYSFKVEVGGCELHYLGSVDKLVHPQAD